MGASALLAYVRAYRDYVFIPAYLIFGSMFVFSLLSIRKDWLSYSISAVIVLIGIYLAVSVASGVNGSLSNTHPTGTQPVDTTDLSEEQKQFEHICKSEGKGWMKMEPMIDGKPTGGQACFGCMPNANTHICDLHEYKEYVNRG